MAAVTEFLYILSAALFVLALRWMSSPETARRAVVAAVDGDDRGRRRHAAPPGNRHLQVDRHRGGRRRRRRLSAVARPAHRRAGADRTLAGLRRHGGRARRHREVLPVAARGRAEFVPHGRGCRRGDPGLPHRHRRLDGRRQARRVHPDAAGHLQGAEHRQHRPAGGRDRAQWPARLGSDAGVGVPDRHCPGADLRRAADSADWRRRHADGHLVPQLLRRPLSRRDGVRPREQAAHRRRRARRIVGLRPVDHHVPRDEPLGDQRPLRRLRLGAGTRRRRRTADREERDGGRRRGAAVQRRQRRDHPGLRHGGGTGAASRPRSLRSVVETRAWT